MGPIRGLKRKKKPEREVDQHARFPSLLSQQRPSDWWDDFSKRITGPSCAAGSSATFESVFKFPRKTFEYICSLVEEEMMDKPTKFTDLSGKVLTLHDRVAVAIKRLSSGESLSAIGESLGVHQSAVYQITWRFVEVMEKRAIQHLRWPSTEEEMEKIKFKFEKMRGFPNCCGAIGTTHVVFCSSSVDPLNEIWLNKDKTYSMILQAIVDPDLRFLDVVAGLPGSLNDSQVLQSSSFFKLSEEGKRLCGKKRKIGMENTNVREFVVGGKKFPLLPWLITPYQGRGLSNMQSNFNERHSATRKVAERALTRLKETWKIIQGVMWRPDKHRLPRIILVCCILHNIIIDLNDGIKDKVPLSNSCDLISLQQLCDSDDKSGSSEREKLANYFSGRKP